MPPVIVAMILKYIYLSIRSVYRGFKLDRCHFIISFISGESKRIHQYLIIPCIHVFQSRGVGWYRIGSIEIAKAGKRGRWTDRLEDRLVQWLGQWATVSGGSAVCVLSVGYTAQHTSTQVHVSYQHYTESVIYRRLCCVTDPSFIVPVVGDQIPKIPTTASKDSFLRESRECWKLPIDVIFSSSKMSTLK